MVRVCVTNYPPVVQIKYVEEVFWKPSHLGHSRADLGWIRSSARSAEV